MMRCTSLFARMCMLTCVLMASCNPLVLLAPSDSTGFVRADLLDACCTCLAARGTAKPGASCERSVLTADGVVGAPDGAVVIDYADFIGDDYDDNVTPEDGDGVWEDGEELPCSCGLSKKQCEAELTQSKSIVVPGACLAQPGTTLGGPCESACNGVFTFDPIEGG